MYNREAAVRYANKWWDSRNPAFPAFDVDCTNFISQCLLAGGAPMHGYPNREVGGGFVGELEFQLVGGTFAALVFSDFKKRIDGNASFVS